MKTHNSTPRNLFIPLLVMIIGLVSAFVFAPMTARQTLETDYANCLLQWQKLQEKAQKEMFSWIQPADLVREKKNFENIEKLVDDMQKQYAQVPKNASMSQMQTAYKPIEQTITAIHLFSSNYKHKLELKQQVARKLQELQEKNKQDLALAEQLASKIKASALPIKYQNVLLDSIASLQARSKALSVAFENVASYYTPEYENKALMDFEAAQKFLSPNGITILQVMSVAQTLTQTNKMFENFSKAEQIVPPSLQNYQNTFQNYQKELYSPSQPLVLRPNAAMKKADSLLNICKNYLQTAQEKSHNKEYIEAYIVLEQLAPIAQKLEEEYSTQKKSYEEFAAHYEAIQKDLKDVDKANLSSSQKTAVESGYREASLAHQLALSYAMAGNWALARSYLQKSETQSEKIYRIVYPNTSKPSYTSTYNTRRNERYSSSSGSSYENSKSWNSNKSNSYSSSSRKSDSRSWGSSSRSSKKSSSSYSSSRKSDSRSWGSRSSSRSRRRR